MNLPAFIQPILNEHAFLAIFVFLIVFGFTLPISEEIALALVGVAARANGQSLLETLAVAYPALLLADCVFYGVARAIGPKLLRSRIFTRFVSVEKVLDGEDYFAQRGPRILFFSRFVVGLRAPAIIAAGLLRMKLRRFFLYDFASVLISTPLWLILGYALGAQFDVQVGTIGKIFAFATPVAIILGSGLVYRSVRRDRRRAMRKAKTDRGEPEPAQGREEA